MVHSRYRYVGSTSTRLIEELSELIHAITKAQRFGLDNYHPKDPDKLTNRDIIRREMADVRRLMSEYEDVVIPLPYGDFHGRTDAENEPEKT